MKLTLVLFAGIILVKLDTAPVTGEALDCD